MSTPRSKAQKETPGKQTTDIGGAVAALSKPQPVSLFQAETELTALERLLEEYAVNESEISEEQLAAAVNAFLEATNAAQSAIERYCWLIFNRLNRSEQRVAQAKVWEGSAKDLRAIAQQEKNLADRLKQRLLEFLDRREITKLETVTFKLNARNNGGKQPLVIDETYSIQHIAQFYPNLIRLEIDTDAVRTYLENGGELPFAHLQERGRSLIIKP